VPSSSGVGDEIVTVPDNGPALSTSGGAPPSSSGSAGGARTDPTSATAGIKAGSCAGFKNGTNITTSTITVGNIADLTGPIPGLFTSAQQAVMAYAAYFNSGSSICGRKIKVVGYDSETSATGDEQAATSACTDTFALVGSVGAFDSGGAATVVKCGIPDLRTISTTPEREASTVSFGTDSVDPTQVSTSQYRFLKSATGNAYQKTAVLYLNAGAAVPNAIAYRKTMTSLGYDVSYFEPIDVTAFNYAPYVAKMKSLGITLVQFEGSSQFAVRLKQAMDEQDFRPVFVMDSAAYDRSSCRPAGTP
jgi:ABC-type branched-subunit amino acid transport system substrate-binding protein